jgi:hypothetical protein
MFTVYLYPNDGTDATVTLGLFKRRGKALRSIIERDLSTDVELSKYPNGKVVVRHSFLRGETIVSNVIRSWDVRNLIPLQDPRDTASGVGSVKAFGVNMKGRVSGRVFRTNGIADTVGAQACLAKHPIDDSYRRPSSGINRMHPHQLGCDT